MLQPKEINFFVENVLGLPQLKDKLSVEDFKQFIFPANDFEIVGVYGKGKNGLVLKISINNEFFALKLTSVSSHAIHEFDIQREFAKWDMAPKLISSDVDERVWMGYRVKYLWAIMEPITTTIFQYIQNKNNLNELYYPFQCLIKKKFLLNYPNPYLHSDMHCGNIVILKDGITLGFIDFGLTAKKPASLQILDAIPLIASCLISVPSSKDTLCSFLVDFYNKMFNVDMKLEKFKRHPAGGYGYFSRQYYLHSYDWPSSQVRNPLPSVKDIKAILPTFKLPKITD